MMRCGAAVDHGTGCTLEQQYEQRSMHIKVVHVHVRVLSEGTFEVMHAACSVRTHVQHNMMWCIATAC